MKKFTALLAVLLCIALALPCTAEGAYTPGETSKAIFANVWNSGKMIQGDTKIRFEMDGAALGMSAEEQKALDAAYALLNDLTISMAAGKLDQGLRLELGAAYKDVAVDAAANLDVYGMTLESNLIEGQKVTAKWETLLAMAGLTDGDIATFMSLREMDWESTMAELTIAAAQYIELVAEMAAPYGQIISEWTGTLYTEVLENVEATEGYPAAAKQIDLYVTAADLGALITQLATYLKDDANVAPLVDMLLMQSGEEMTTADLCDAAIAVAAEMTDTENPILLTFALDAQDNPLYVQFFAFQLDGSAVFAEIIGAPSALGGTDYALNAMTLTAEGDLVDAFSVTGTASEQDFSMLLQVYAGGAQVVGWELISDAEAIKTAEGMDGLNTSVSMTMNAEDGVDSVQMVMNSLVSSHLTADGGEVTDTTMNMDMYADGESISMISTAGMSVFPTADGLTGTYGTSQSMPAMGLTSYGADIALSTKAYDAAATAALAEFALDSATTEGIDELMNTLSVNAMTKMEELTKVLPPEVSSMLAGE